jgi:hypothetical protein
MQTKPGTHDNSAAFAQAFFIGNLLFVGPFYLALWILFLLRYEKTSAVGRSHIKQALIASSVSTGIFIVINLGILLNNGYASLSALLALEVYFMLIVPAFLLVGILAFVRAIKGQIFNVPFLARARSDQTKRT